MATKKKLTPAAPRGTPGRKPDVLAEKERRFVLAYMGDARGNATEAAVFAGYGGSRAVVAITANRLLKNPKIKRALRSHVAKLEARGIATAAEIDARLSAILRDGDAATADRIAAARELNKVTGRHIVRLDAQVDHTLTITHETLRRMSDAELVQALDTLVAEAVALRDEVAKLLPATEG